MAEAKKMLVKCETKSNRVKGCSFHPKLSWVLASLHKSFSWAVLLRLPCQRLRWMMTDSLNSVHLTLPCQRLPQMMTDLLNSVHLTSTAFRNIHFK